MAKRSRSEGRRRERLSSVATAIRLLQAFSEDEVEIGISDLARRLAIAKSTAHRLAVTLVSEGMLEQDRGTGKYRLGVALFRLGALVRRRMEVSNEARPFLYDLREKINESVHLAILDGSEIMYVYNLESTHAIRSRRAQARALHSRRAGDPGVPAARGDRQCGRGRARAAHAQDHHGSR